MTFVVSAVLIAALVRPAGPPSAVNPKPSFVQEIGLGLGFIRTNRGLMTMLGLILAMNFIDEAYIPVLLPVYSRDILSDPRLAGWLLGAIVCLAALAVTRAGRAGLPNLTGACCMLLAFGRASGPLNPIINTLVQEVTPAALRGRVFGLIGATAYAAAPLGILAASSVVSVWGLHTGLMAFGALYMLVFIAAWHSRSLNEFADGRSRVVH